MSQMHGTDYGMRELHGVVYAADELSEDRLKHQAVLFDRFYMLGLDRLFSKLGKKLPPGTSADFDFLIARGLVQIVSPDHLSRVPYFDDEVIEPGMPWVGVMEDSVVRHVASSFQDGANDVVGICQHPLPRKLRMPANMSKQPSTMETTLRVALDALPIPGGECSWQEIIDFKAELRDKRWGFRRFLRTLATKQQTEAEIRDEIEWLVKEYRKAMEIHHIKASQSFIDVFLITPLEVIENLVKFNWSKIAKGIVQVQKRKAELLEAEMKAPGRECAYVFDARQRFSLSSRQE